MQKKFNLIKKRVELQKFIEFLPIKRPKTKSFKIIFCKSSILKSIRNTQNFKEVVEDLVGLIAKIN